MKKTMLKTVALAALAFSLPAFAAKVIITGQPVLLEKRGDIYYTPSSFQTTTTYQYVNLGTENRVCYLEKQPDLVSLNALSIKVNVGGKEASWNCYPTDANFFTIQ